MGKSPAQSAVCNIKLQEKNEADTKKYSGENTASNQ